ncbi:uncharacterized protein BX664DRAFT_341091 [Halteromyces radiatus]|uniref:uncharacterized protein n=1 Tax=Halteromyces radiatus TaxID=101107 RepID=UPI00221F3442|nr:uncharacterized protein BX664DRAFT_341091 [Halteromyces radiatus]KAI8081714.1 hypothetical protein BX664DRAFT_341091 [Halteromyces radiatus]
MGSSRKHHRQDDSGEHERRHSKRSRNKDQDTNRTHLDEQLIGTIQPISTDDYFEKASEFRIWLKEKKHKYFNELDADDARYYFKKFVKAWNKYELDEKYYKGINSAHVSSSDTTSYKWSFAKNLNTEELDYIKDKVDSMTGRGEIESKTSSSSAVTTGKRRTNVGPSLPPTSRSSNREDQIEKEERWEKERQQRKAEYQAQKRRTNDYINETVPKLEGREAKLAEKRATNSLRRRERSPDVELNDNDIYGSGGDDYKSRLAIERRNQERRQARFEAKKEERMGPIKEKLADYKAKENETMAMFRKMAEEQKRRGGL